MNFEFDNPEFLWLLLLIPLIAILKGKKGKSASIRFSSVAIAKEVSQLSRSGMGRFFFFLRLLALACLILALARPRMGKGESYIEASGIDIVLAVDISGSMMGLDFSTKDKLITRLDVAKSVIDQFIEKRPNDRIGLIAFARNPYLVSPLTLNHDWLKKNLNRLRVGLVEDGTAIGNAIAMSVNRLKDLPSKSRIVILLTDGENNAGNIPPVAAAELAASFDVKVYTIAAGKGGITPTLLIDDKGNVVKNAYGKPEIFQANMPVDQETLVKVADITDAKSYQADSTEELKNIYEEINRFEKTDVKLKQYSNYQELFAYPAILGLCIIGLEKFLTNTRYRRLP